MVLRRLTRWSERSSEVQPRGSSSYYVNEDKPTNRAIVHRDDGPCEVPRPKLERDGKWHGPFDTKDEALRVARGTGRKDARECKVKGCCLLP